MIYIVYLCCILILTFVKKKINQKKIIDIIILIIMTVIYGIRYDVGIDYLNYEFYYNNPSGNLEFLFDSFINLFRFFNINFWLYSVFLGFLMFYLLYLIGKYLDIPYEKIIIFFILTGRLFVSFNLVRQTIAGMIVLFAFRYITRSDFKKYILCVMVAGLIHTTAFIFIPFYFIKSIKINKWLGLILFSIGGLLYFTDISMMIINFITPDKYLPYFEGKYNYHPDLGFGVLFYIVVAVIVWFSTSKREDNLYPFSMAYILGYTIFLFTLKSFIVSRLAAYCSLAFVPILPYMLINRRKLGDPFLYINIGIVLIYIAIFANTIYGIYGADTENLMYKTIFK